LSTKGTFAEQAAFDIDGPDVNLGACATLALSMLWHELATNALKYGSLSAPSGRVTVDWHLAPHEIEERLVLRWKEIGGPPAHAPDRKGFGSKLIRMVLVGTGGAEFRYTSSGFEAEFHAAIAQLQHS
jgi:two-component sensor histidine kinase